MEDFAGPDPIQEAIIQSQIDALRKKREQMLAIRQQSANAEALPNLAGYTPSEQTGYYKQALAGMMAGMKKPKLKDLSVSERKDLALYTDTLQSIEDTMPTIEKYKDYFGYGSAGNVFQGVRDTLGIDTEDAIARRRLDSALNNLAMRFQNAISGKQMTDSEAKRLKKFLPTAGMDYETAIFNLKQLQRELKSKYDVRVSAYSKMGYDVPDFMAGVKRRDNSGGKGGVVEFSLE